jgi:Ferritin-like domain
VLSTDLVRLAHEESDYVGAQFLGCFLEEQREEVASMSSLLAVVDRATTSNLLLGEDYLARSQCRRVRAVDQRSTGRGTGPPTVSRTRLSAARAFELELKTTRELGRQRRACDGRSNLRCRKMSGGAAPLLGLDQATREA